MSSFTPPASLRCTRCDDPLPPSFQAGLCPLCLMDMAMRPTNEGTLPVAPPQKPLTPEELAPHFPQLEILECIGRGGMGVVYKARQKTLGRLVALKLLAPGQTKDAAFAERFASEARALAALNHPNIVTVHDFGESGSFFYLLMEYVDGANLRQAMRGPHLSPEQALTIVPPICEALQYAHEHGIVHRDIKPENLLLDKAGRIKIADFGIAKMMGSEKSAEAGGPQTDASGPHHTIVAGTPEYMAPEQRAASAKADHRADIYSLGVVLYELLTGKRPPSSLAIPVQEAGASTLLDEIVRRAMAEDPEQRYQTVAELQQHLATLTSPPSAAQMWPRTGYEHRLSRTLHAAGLLWMLYGLGRLAAPGATLDRLPFVLPPSLATLQQGLLGAVLLWLLAWALIRWREPLVRVSYRPLTVPPERVAEVFAFGVRLLGLWLVIDSFSELSTFSPHLYTHLIIGDTMRLLLGVGLFFFEHVFAPVFHALPVWKPLPFATAPPRRALCGHALGGGLLLALLLWLIVNLVWRYCECMINPRDWADLRPEDLLAAMARVFWMSAVISGIGWTAVKRIRHSGGHLYGLVAATPAAFALPAVLLFSTLVFMLYSPLAHRLETHVYLPDGSVQTILPPQPLLLVQVSAGAGGLCLLCWIGVWLKLRRLPKPAPLLLPARRLGIMTVPVWFFVFAAPLYMLVVLDSRALPRATIPMEQFARHVERQLNLKLFATGFQHDLPQGFLKLPPAGGQAMQSLSGMRDAEGRKAQGMLHLKWLHKNPQDKLGDSLEIFGHLALGKIHMVIDRTSSSPLLREVVIPSPAGSRRCLWRIRQNGPSDATDELQQKLLSGTELTAEDYAWLNEKQMDLVPDPREEGTLLLLGGAVQVTDQAPADFSWLTLDDRQVSAALAKAREIRDARPGRQGFTHIRERSPALVAFVTRSCFGLLENLGPSRPGAKDIRLRVHLLERRPYDDLLTH